MLIERAALLGRVGGRDLHARPLPQFGGRSFSALLSLGLLSALLTLSWLTAYSFAVATARLLLARPRVLRTLDGPTGSVLIGFGVRLAAERR